MTIAHIALNHITTLLQLHSNSIKHNIAKSASNLTANLYSSGHTRSSLAHSAPMPSPWWSWYCLPGSSNTHPSVQTKKLAGCELYIYILCINTPPKRGFAVSLHRQAAAQATANHHSNDWRLFVRLPKLWTPEMCLPFPLFLRTRWPPTY